MFKLRVFMFGVALLAWAATVHADPLERRSRVELRVGFWNLGRDRVVTRVGPMGTEMTAGNGNIVGGLAYGYWVKEDLSVQISFSVVGAEWRSSVSSMNVSQYTAAVLPILFGVRYYLPKSTLKKAARPYLTAGAGPYIGGETGSEVSGRVVQSTRTTGSFGGHVGGGLDVQVSRHFMLGVDAGYNFMKDFSEPVGGRENYNGFELGVGISFLFGGGIE